MYVMVLRDKAEKNMARKNEKEEALKFDEKGDRVNACQVNLRFENI